jgi:arsenate reductase
MGNLPHDRREHDQWLRAGEVVRDGLLSAKGRVMERAAVAGRPRTVLFLCTGNSARSILAESLLNHWGREKFRAFSGGSQPRGTVHPIALELLTHLNLPTAGLRSKNWDEFARPDAPRIDFIITVCDAAAGEACPVWPGHPVTAHWGMPDPAAVTGPDTEKWLAFRDTLRALESRIKLFVNLPLVSLDRLALRREIEALAETRGSTSQ